jgi:NAD(P)-dependent dehydrogenase (short-subunit alcohol dehydrogenase family)
MDTSLATKVETNPTRVAVVTGGAQGIGKACVQRLSEAGYAVIIADVSPHGESIVLELKRDGFDASFLHCDTSLPADINRLFAVVGQSHGGVDVLVNNAAITRPIPFFDVTADDWDQILGVNARGYFLVLQAAATQMREKGRGAIVNVASIAGKGWKETSNIAYASSKGAVIAMTRIAAAQLGEHGIRVNAVCPGMTQTDLMLGWLKGRAEAEGRKEAALMGDLVTNVALGRLNTPENVADAVAFLASDAASNVTGQSLNIDGGILWD